MKKLLVVALVLAAMVAAYTVGVRAGMAKFFGAQEVRVEDNLVIFDIDGDEYVFVYEEVGA